MQWTFEERARVVLRLARAEVRMADVMAHHGLTPATVEIWVGEFLHAAKERFSAEMLAQLRAQGLTAEEIRAEQFGRIEEVQPLDLLQSLSIYRRPGHVLFFHAHGVSRIWFEDGEVVDARSGALRREAALYRIVAHEAGDYQVEVTGESRPRRIEAPTSALLFEAARRLDEGRRLAPQLPSAEAVLRAAPGVLMTAGLSDAHHRVAEAFGRGATLGEVLERSPLGDLETRTLVADLLAKALLCPLAETRMVDVPSQERRVQALRKAEREISQAVVASTVGGLVDPGLAPRRRRWVPALAGSLAASAIITAGVLLGTGTEPPAPPSPTEVIAVAEEPAPVAVTGPPPSRCPDDMVFLPAREKTTADGPKRVDAVCIDRHEVTAAQYQACADRGDCSRGHTQAKWPRRPGAPMRAWKKRRAEASRHCNIGREGAERHPMNCVTWEQAKAYCRSRDRRLPSEDQWEAAARGLDERRFPWGSSPPTAERTNACGTECTEDVPAYAEPDQHPSTAPVGRAPKGATPEGVHELSGNVREWTSDEAQRDGSDDENRRVVRGGGFTTVDRAALGTTHRETVPAAERRPDLGFRCVRSPDP